MIILFNPSAGKGNALKQKNRLEQLLSRYNVPHELVVTRSEENLKELTRENARRGRTVVGAGGDSTFHIMVGEIMKAGEHARFGMIGLGSSNDISREFDVDTLEKACQALKAGRVTRIDLGCISKEGTTLAYFVGQANIGLGAWVNRFVEELAVRSPRLGKIQSLAGALGIIRSYKAKKTPQFLTIESEAGKIEGPFVLAVFSNIRYWATGRMINPAARPNDGRLDACLIKSCSLPRLVRLAALSRKGRHITAREVKVLRSSEYLISSELPFQVQADGEIIGGRGASAVFNKVKFTIIPQALNVICEMGFKK